MRGHGSVVVFQPVACFCKMTTEKELIKVDKTGVLAPLLYQLFLQQIDTVSLNDILGKRNLVNILMP